MAGDAGPIDRGLWAGIRGPGTRDPGFGIRDSGFGIRGSGLGIRDLECGCARCLSAQSHARGDKGHAQNPRTNEDTSNHMRPRTHQYARF